MHYRNKTMEAIRQDLFHELYKGGTWQDLKEDMTKMVVKIASQKFKLTEEADSRDMSHFCNELYVDLANVIQASLIESIEQQDTHTRYSSEKYLDNPLQPLQNLQQLAEEYEAEGDHQSANRCHQDKILNGGRSRSDAWFEYGAFCMRGKSKNHGKAEECFHSANASGNSHVLGCQALACLFFSRGASSKAETLLQSILEMQIEEEHIVWILLSQIHEEREDEASVQLCIKKAKEHYERLKKSKIPLSKRCQKVSNLLSHPFSLARLLRREKLMDDPFADTALVLLDLHLPSIAEKVLTLANQTFSSGMEYKILLSRAYELLHKFDKVEEIYNEALELLPDDPNLLMLIGHSRFVCCNYQGSIQSYERLIRLHHKEPYFHVYIELGKSYLVLEDYRNSKESYVKGCSKTPCMSTWLGAGIAFYKLGDMKHAEVALIKATSFEIHNFKIWGFLVLVCIALDRIEEARVSLHQALKTTTEATLLADIGAAFANMNQFSDAELAFIESLKEQENPKVRRMLVQVLRQNEEWKEQEFQTKELINL